MSLPSYGASSFDQHERVPFYTEFRTQTRPPLVSKEIAKVDVDRDDMRQPEFILNEIAHDGAELRARLPYLGLMNRS